MCVCLLLEFFRGVFYLFYLFIFSDYFGLQFFLFFVCLFFREEIFYSLINSFIYFLRCFFFFIFVAFVFFSSFLPFFFFLLLLLYSLQASSDHGCLPIVILKNVFSVEIVIIALEFPPEGLRATGVVLIAKPLKLTLLVL